MHLFDVMVIKSMVQLQSKALYYYCDMTQSQNFLPMGAQCSLKAALPLAERITVSNRDSNAGSYATTL